MHLNSDERQSFKLLHKMYILYSEMYILYFASFVYADFYLCWSDNINLGYVIEFFVWKKSVENVPPLLQITVKGCFVNSNITALKVTTWCIPLSLWNYFLSPLSLKQFSGTVKHTDTGTCTMKISHTQSDMERRFREGAEKLILG